MDSTSLKNLGLSELRRMEKKNPYGYPKKYIT